MSRIQAKVSGRKQQTMRIKPKEIRKSSEESLIKRGAPSKRWASISSKPPRAPLNQ